MGFWFGSRCVGNTPRKNVCGADNLWEEQQDALNTFFISVLFTQLMCCCVYKFRSKVPTVL